MKPGERKITECTLLIKIGELIKIGKPKTYFLNFGYIFMKIAQNIIIKIIIIIIL